MYVLLNPDGRVTGYASSWPGVAPLARPGCAWVELPYLPSLGSQVVVCGCCGAVHGPREWPELAQCGVVDGALEQRHCGCGSTLSVEI